MPEGIGYDDPQVRTPQNADPTLDNFFRDLLAGKEGGGPLGVLPQSPEMGRDPRQLYKGMGAALSRAANIPIPPVVSSPIQVQKLPPIPGDPIAEEASPHAIDALPFEDLGTGPSDQSVARAELAQLLEAEVAGQGPEAQQATKVSNTSAANAPISTQEIVPPIPSPQLKPAVNNRPLPPDDPGLTPKEVVLAGTLTPPGTSTVNVGDSYAPEGLFKTIKAARSSNEGIETMFQKAIQLIDNPAQLDKFLASIDPAMAEEIGIMLQERDIGF